MDALLGLITFGAVAYFLVWKDFLEPLLGLDKRAQRVKTLPPLPAYKRRSRRSEGSEPVNAGSGHSDAVEPIVQVQPSVQSSAQIAAVATAPGGTDSADGDFTLSPRELTQLSEALNLYREGATIEQAVCRAFNVTKGGSEGWKRAKRLFDAATVPPGAAPTGIYTAQSPVKRRRRVTR